MSRPPKDIRQQREPAFNLLCCPSALPATFRYLTHILPSGTTHLPLRQKPLALGPILTPFLVVLAAGAPATPARMPTFDPYVLLIQVKQVKQVTPSSSTHKPAIQSPPQRQGSKSRYFGSLTPDKQLQDSSGGTELVKGNVYLEVDKVEAEIILRLPGSGAENIGDGEVWIQVDGMEKIWCDNCKVWWEFRAWVRET